MAWLRARSGGSDRTTSAPVTGEAIRDHLANERTLLAWQRTALALVATGFLVDRFALEPADGTVLGSLLGTLVIISGAVVSVVGAVRFRRTAREIDTGTFLPGILAHLILAAAVAISALAIAVFILLVP